MNNSDQRSGHIFHKVASVLERHLWRRTGAEIPNNWDLSPWPDSMYEPVLKLRMRDMAGSTRGSEPDDSAFMVKYDPTIVRGQYSQPLTPKQREFHIGVFGELVKKGRKTQAQLEKELNRLLPYESEQAKNILGSPSSYDTFAATKTLVDRVLRVKAYGCFGNQSFDPERLIESYGYVVNDIRKKKFPVISDDPQKTVLYIYRNYIRMPDLNPVDYGGGRRFEGVKNIEICLHAVVMTKIFNLRLQDYVEVEPHWHRLAQIEVSA